MRRLVITVVCLLLSTCISVLTPTSASGKDPAAPAEVRLPPIATKIEDRRLCVFLPGMRSPRSVDTRCGSLSAAPMRLFSGPATGVPRRGTVTGTTTGDWGLATAAMGSLLAPQVIDRMRTFVLENDGPWPNRKSPTAKKNRKVRYNLYQIWFRRHDNRKIDTWKYGITKTSLGPRRPKSQISACEGHRDSIWQSCKWKWMRTKIVGWFRARALETTYCIRYKARVGRRPVAMTRCV